MKTCSSDYNITSKDILNSDVPNVYASNIYRCCNSSQPVVLNASALANNSGGVGSAGFEWYTENGTSLGSGSISILPPCPLCAGITQYGSTIVAPVTTNARYRVVFRDVYGCKNEAWMYVVNRPIDAAVEISTDFSYAKCLASPTVLSASIFRYFFCSDENGGASNVPYYQLATDPIFLTYQWSTGETTQSINVHPGVTSYTVTVSNGCFSSTANVDISTFHPMTGPLPTLCYACNPTPKGQMWCSNAMQIGSPTRRFVFKMSQLNPAWAAAYNARSYKLQIYDRTGAMVYMNTNLFPSSPVSGFYNGEIYWDGTKNNGIGTRVGFVNANETYYWQFWLINCDQTGYYKGNILALQ
ncbi:MAG: hypothetical protein ABI378_13630 [Chitinophagaceae bacterium]